MCIMDRLTADDLRTVIAALLDAGHLARDAEGALVLPDGRRLDDLPAAVTVADLMADSGVRRLAGELVGAGCGS